MAKRKAKTEPKPVLSPDQEKDQVRREVIDILLTNARTGDNRAIDLLGRLKDYDLFTKPTDVVPEGGITEKTARILIALEDGNCPKCGHHFGKIEEDRHPIGCRCVECTLKRTGELQPKPEVDVSECTMLEGKDV